MSLHKRLKALESSMAPPKPGARIFLDDEPTFEVTGVSWCQGYEQKRLDRLDGESFQELKLRCLHEARRYPGGVVFLMDYGPARVPNRCEGMFPCHALDAGGNKIEIPEGERGAACH